MAEDSPISIVQSCYGCWGSGGFNDENAMDNAKKFFCDDAVFDMSADMKNTDAYKVKIFYRLIN